MTRAADNHTDDTAALKAVIASQRTEIEHLKLLVAKLTRMQFGRRAERFDDCNIDQLNLLSDTSGL
jgi:transposase